MRLVPLFMLLSAIQATSAEEPWVQAVVGPTYFAVDVGDMDASVSWYRSAFGVDVIDDTTADDGRWRIVNLANNDFAIELIWKRRSATAESGNRIRGFTKLGVGVADVRAVADRVDSATGQRPRVVEFEPHGVRLVQLEDPEGNTIQLHSPLEAPDSDEAILLQMHRDVLRYHINSDVESWIASESEDYVSANGGEITHPTLEERRAGRAPYLNRTTFSVYRDLVEPEVRVSDDGSLGWVICQVQMAGEQHSDGGEPIPIEAVWAWIELYEKRDGEWVTVGNVSNKKFD